MTGTLVPPNSARLRRSIDAHTRTIAPVWYLKDASIICDSLSLAYVQRNYGYTGFHVHWDFSDIDILLAVELRFDYVKCVECTYNETATIEKCFSSQMPLLVASIDYRGIHNVIFQPWNSVSRIVERDLMTQTRQIGESWWKGKPFRIKSISTPVWNDTFI
jgi:hypothetical protein